MLRFVAIVYWILLITWLAALVAGASTAMASFGTLTKLVPELGITVPQFAATDPSGADAGRYVAGFVAQSVFDRLATIEWVLVPAMLLTLLLQRASRWPERGPANAIRVTLLLIVCATTMYHLVVLGPRMANALGDYRGAIRGSDAASAAIHKEAFDRDHRVSDPILRTNAFLLLGVVLLSAAGLTPRSVPNRSGPTFS
jgi:hypothetical protein